MLQLSSSVQVILCLVSAVLFICALWTQWNEDYTAIWKKVTEEDSILSVIVRLFASLFEVTWTLLRLISILLENLINCVVCLLNMVSELLNLVNR